MDFKSATKKVLDDFALIQARKKCLNGKHCPEAEPEAAALILADVYANLPAAGVANRLFWATDILTMFRDTGTAWEVVGAQWYMREIHTQKFAIATTTLTTGYVWYSPIQVPRTVTVDGIIVYHDAIAAGNLYIALYDHLGYLPNNRLAVSASTACNGPNRSQFVPFANPLRITPNVYFAAIESDNNLDSYVSALLHVAFCIPADVGHGLKWFYQNLGAYLIPPVTATPTYADDMYQCLLMSLRISSIP